MALPRRILSSAIWRSGYAPRANSLSSAAPSVIEGPHEKLLRASVISHGSKSLSASCHKQTHAICDDTSHVVCEDASLGSERAQLLIKIVCIIAVSVSVASEGSSWLQVPRSGRRQHALQVSVVGHFDTAHLNSRINKPLAPAELLDGTYRRQRQPGARQFSHTPLDFPRS